MNYYEWYWALIIVISLLYSALIFWFTNGWKAIPEFKSSPISRNTSVSIIIPFYNEEKHLERCVNQIANQIKVHPSVELLLINDFSTDNSIKKIEKIVSNYTSVNLIQNKVKGKKNALIEGINNAKGELIITTDADCNHSAQWVETMVSFYESEHPDLIIAPVILSPINKSIEHFQYLEFTSLIASAAGAAGINHPIMCNAANMAFKKSTFLTLKDPLKLKYESGDDVFLLHAIKQTKNHNIQYLKNTHALVSTKPQPSIKSFIYQRQRWASKAKGYTDKDTSFTAGIILSQALLLLFGGCAIVFNPVYIKPLLAGLLIKTLIDTYFFHHIDSFFKTKKYIPLIFVFELFYFVYIALSATLGLFENNWKRTN